jgi:hypothetical protein
MMDFTEFLKVPEWRPRQIDVRLLKQLDIAPSKESETIHALEFLGILGENGSPTAEFDNLKTDYTGALRRLVLEKYRNLFELIPPEMINQSRLVKFFGLSADTAEYQAKLFAWLCEQAEIALPALEKHIHRQRPGRGRPTV